MERGRGQNWSLPTLKAYCNSSTVQSLLSYMEKIQLNNKNERIIDIKLNSKYLSRMVMLVKIGYADWDMMIKIGYPVTPVNF